MFFVLGCDYLEVSCWYQRIVCVKDLFVKFIEEILNFGIRFLCQGESGFSKLDMMLFFIIILMLLDLFFNYDYNYDYFLVIFVVFIKDGSKKSMIKVIQSN